MRRMKRVLASVFAIIAASTIAAGAAVAGQAPDQAPAAPPGPNAGPSAGDAPYPGHPDLVPVVHPEAELDRLSEKAKAELIEARRVFDELAASGPPDDVLAKGFGRLGQLYYVYDLLDPALAAFADAATLQPDTFDWHYYLGAITTAEGDLERAEQELRRAVELRPEDLGARVRLGRVLQDASRPEEAEEQLGAALEIDPDSAAALYGLGKIRYDSGATEEAVALLEKALALQPGATSIHHLLGLAYRKLRDLDKAREHLAANKGDPVLFPDPLVSGLDSLLHGAKLDTIAGNNAMEEGDLDGAIAAYRRGLEAEPDNASLHYNLAVALTRAGQRPRALKELERAVEIDPDYRDAQYNLAAALRQEGRFDEAAEHYRRAFEIDSQDHLAHLEWAATLDDAGQPERAAEEARAILEQAPDYEPAPRAGAHLLLARLAEAAGREGEVLEHLRSAVEETPDDPRAVGPWRWRSAGGELRRGGGAVHAIDRAGAEDFEARFARAMALILDGQDGAARQALEADLDQVGEVPPLVQLLARLLAASPGRRRPRRAQGPGARPPTARARAQPGLRGDPGDGVGRAGPVRARRALGAPGAGGGREARARRRGGAGSGAARHLRARRAAPLALGPALSRHLQGPTS